MKVRKITVKPYIEAALLVSLGLLLSTITVMRMPMGGSVTLGASVPICLVGLRNGVHIGMMSGLCYGIISFLMGGLLLGAGPFLCDYIFAYTALGLTGLFRLLPEKKSGTLYAFLFVAISQITRLFFHVLSGILFFTSAEQSFSAALIYSLSYNLSYLLPDTIIGLTIFYKLIKKSKNMIHTNGK